MGSEMCIRDRFSTTQLIDWFGLEAIGKSPARFDTEKLDNVNAQHLNMADDSVLVAQAIVLNPALADFEIQVTAAMPLLKTRATRLPDIAADAAFLAAERPIIVDEKLQKHLNEETRPHLQALATALEALDSWTSAEIEAVIKAYMDDNELKMGKLAPAFRASLVGSSQSPGIFDVLALLGKNEALKRLNDKIGA